MNHEPGISKELPLLVTLPHSHRQARSLKLAALQKALLGLVTKISHLRRKSPAANATQVRHSWLAPSDPSAPPFRYSHVQDARAFKLLVAQDDKISLRLMILMMSSSQCPAGLNGS